MIYVLARKACKTFAILTILSLLLLSHASPVYAADDEPASIQDRLNAGFEVLTDAVKYVLFFEIFKVPFIISVLVAGGIFFTLRYGFINLRLFRHAIHVVLGKYDDPDDVGEISHFRALTSALAATVGLGNIAGVAIAITMGGPGAIFWMWLTAFFGMSMKFSSCALGHLYRDVHPDGRVLGGPMVYIKKGIAEAVPSMAWLGCILSPIYAILTIMAAVGAGNMFQTNQTYAVVANVFHFEKVAFLNDYGAWIIGAIMATLTGIVVIGGLKRIGEVTCRMVPAMCAGYIAICMVIVGANFTGIPGVFTSIVTQAFSPEAAFGGFIGVLIIGMRRAAFSNEAGMGSAAIVYAAAKGKEPIREGLVSMLGPFIDTIVVCTMTAMAILITNSHLDNEEGVQGVVITARAFSSVACVSTIFPYFLGIAVFVFAFSTVISWSYYGERATEYLFGLKGIMPYRIAFVAVALVGPVLSLEKVIDFSDAMMLSMAFPNIVGMIFISGKLKRMINDYVARLKAGEM